MRQELVTLNYYRFGQTHIFHEVQAEVCQECGMQYLEAAVLNELDKIILERKEGNVSL